MSVTSSMALTFLSFLLLCGAGVLAAPQQKVCDEFYYYDHGTDLCEHCSDICDAADLKRTMDQCWEKCQSYALVLWPPKPVDLTLAPSKSGEEHARNSNNSQFPLVAQIAVCVLVIGLLVGVALSLAIVRRRKNAMNRPPMAQQAEDQTARDGLLPSEVNNSSAADASARATFGEEISGSAAGIQEEGGERRGTASRGTAVERATPGDEGGRSRASRQPVAVSPEGDSAPSAMILLGPPRIGVRSAAIHRPDSAADVNLDSTELKTLLPSMSADSSFAGPGEDPAETTF